MFNKKEKEIEVPYEYAVITWHDFVSKRGVCIGRSLGAEITVVRNGMNVEIYPLDDAIIEWLENDRFIPVVDATKGEMFPQSCVEAPLRTITLGRVKI